MPIYYKGRYSGTELDAGIAFGVNPDETPTEGSTKGVTSGGVRRAADAATRAALAVSTASGATVDISDGAAGQPVIAMTLDIFPTQSGDGTPSPDNVRPISGLSRLILSHGDGSGTPAEYPFDFERVVFGGILDVLTGRMNVSKVGFVFDGSESWAPQGSGSSLFFRTTSAVGIKAENSQTRVRRGCSHFRNASITTGNETVGFAAYTGSGDEYIRLQFRPDLTTIPDVDAWKEFLRAQYYDVGEPVTCWCEIIEGATVIPLNPVQIRTLLGANVFGTDYAAAEISVTYYRDPSILADSLTPDEELDTTSDRPVANRAAATAIADLQLDRSLAEANLNSIDDILYTVSYISELDLDAGSINPANGANASGGGKACRTGYLRLPKDGQDMIFSLGSADYECTSWSYSGKSVGSATHSNTVKTWVPCDRRVCCRALAGDKYFRIAFRRVDGEDLTDADYTAISDAFAAMKYAQSESPLNLINQDLIKGNSGVTVTHNDDGTITAETVTDGTYRYFRCLSDMSGLKPNHVYVVHVRVLAMSGTTAGCSLRFRGIDSNQGSLALGIGSIRGPGEYAAFVRTTGFETNFDFLLTGRTSASASVTVSEIMLAKADISLPFVSFGVSRDTIAPALGAAADSRMLGRENALAHAAQYTQVRFCPVLDFPANDGGVFDADKVHQGVPYSSARMVDKLVGPQISLHTFLTAVRNPRSVVYTRILTYYNSMAYYGCVCSAYVSHAYHQRVNWTTESLASWDRLERIRITDIRAGDILLNGGHVRFITGVYRDVYGRILGVGWSEAGTPEVHATNPLPWEAFLRDIDAEDPDDVYYPYRYKDLADVEYVPDPEAPGYPDEPFYATTDDYSCEVVPDIMSEYGDRAVLLEGEDTVINVLDATGYDTITVRIDGVVVQTITVLEDFSLSALAPGLYEITMTGPDGKATSTQFFVCAATCAMTGTVLSFGSANATPVAVYTYTGPYQDTQHPTTRPRAANRLVPLTDAAIAAGSIDLADYLDELYQYAKIAFAPTDYPEWGVATWYTNSPESLGFWVAI